MEAKGKRESTQIRETQTHVCVSTHKYRQFKRETPHKGREHTNFWVLGGSGVIVLYFKKNWEKSCKINRRKEGGTVFRNGYRNGVKVKYPKFLLFHRN